MRILSIDGGGMKGIISAIVLKRLEELLKIYAEDETAGISDYFELVGGTSTGAIITALLLVPDEQGRAKYSADDILNLYLDHGKEIFERRMLYPVSTLVASRYKNKKLEELLDYYLKGLTLEDMRKDCLFTAYNMSNRRAVFFSSLSKKEWERENYQMKDIVLASTAAPTYFPPKKMFNEHCPNNCHIDGGVIANNPSLCLLVESLKMPQATRLDKIMLLSIGNASCPEYYDYNSVKRWGFAKWAFPILNILMDGSEDTVHYQMQRIFDNLECSKQYLRIEKKMEQKIPDMDAVSKEAAEEFVSIGEQLVLEKDAKLKAFARMLVKSASKS